MRNPLDAVISRSLTGFVRDLAEGNWTGRREREMVSLFVFGHLLREVAPGGFIHDTTQIGIEVPVPQVARSAHSKMQVCKDVVIWPKPLMTCWDTDGNPTVGPAAILEWKLDEESRRDIDWLQAFSKQHLHFIGYAVVARPRSGAFILSCARIENGRVAGNWLRL
jgi:hypothetical protein